MKFAMISCAARISALPNQIIRAYTHKSQAALDTNFYCEVNKMPVFHFHVPEGFSVEKKNKIADAANKALVVSCNVPEGDRFITISEHKAGELHIHPTFMDMKRSKDAIIVDVLIGAHRPLEQRKALFRAMADLLEEMAGVRPDDLFIAAIPVPNENFSFGKGEAQLAGIPPRW
jgi:Tautomerase enzyme